MLKKIINLVYDEEKKEITDFGELLIVLIFPLLFVLAIFEYIFNLIKGIIKRRF